MKHEKTTRRPSRRSGMEWFDSILSGGLFKQLGIFTVTILTVYVLCVLAIWMCRKPLFISEKADQLTFAESLQGVLYHFMDSGNLYQEQSANTKIITTIISFLGMVLLSGLLITTLTNIVGRRVDNVAKGLVTYRRIRNHYVIIGYGDITVCLLNDIFRHEESADGAERLPKIIILTSQDAQQVRAQIQSQLPGYQERNVLIYSGDIESEEHIARLNIENAREVYILGEAEERGRDSKNLECVRIVRELRSRGTKTIRLLRKMRSKGPAGRMLAQTIIRILKSKGIRGGILTVNVQLDRPASYSTVKKLNIPADYVMDGRRQVLYFRPFNFFENWARLLWGYYRQDDYDVLDFDPEGAGDTHVLCEGSKRHVHLVIVGFNRMGRALLLEALRIGHYPNFDEKTGANKTVITVVDPEMDILRPQFESQYPYIKEVDDVEIEYRKARVEDQDIRTMLERSATGGRELLTVAVCLSDPDMSLATGLSLPEALYFRIENKEIASNGNVRILIRQELQKGIGAILKSDEHKYRHVKVFGMLTEGISRELLDDTASMWVNANFTDKSIIENADIRKARLLWYRASEDFRYSNRYQIEMYDIYERYEDCTPKETLYRMEHLRWCSERRVFGYRKSEIKDKKYKTHHLLVPYSELPAREKNKDMAVIETRRLIESLCKGDCTAENAKPS